jgi:NAD(P)-dependent dehydrogenase (short-subunit alcohol dehydrogenase family)
MKLDFSDQVVIVTGAAGNLGSAVALAFRSLGARLALVERQEQLLEEAFPELMDDPDCLMNGRADLTNPEDVQAMVDQAMERFGRVDVLANTVGGYRAGPPVHETELNTWDFMLTLNAKVAFLTSRAVIPVMLSQGRGKIVHIGARPGLRGSAGAAAYSASKAAVIRLTESAAAEYRKQGININCILPGTIDTADNRQSMPDADFSKWVQPESLADVILFLCSDLARDINGAAVPVYGLT